MAILRKGIPVAKSSQRGALKGEPLGGAFFWLSVFYAVYCVRPEDWIPGLAYLPLAKISTVLALVALIMSVGRSKRRFLDLPREAIYFLGIIVLLFISAFLSTVWKGGAFYGALDFSKAFIAWMLTFLVITSFARLKKIIFLQSASVAVITLISVLKGRSHPRLDGVIGGIYSNPNDLAFAIVLCLPFCFAFLLSTRSLARKAAWGAAMLMMCAALFMTASRGGFIDLLVTGAVCLWVFGIKGRRIHLVAAAAVVVIMLALAGGGKLKDRFFAISENNVNNGLEESAHDSYEERRQMIFQSLHVVARYPWGIGVGNFAVYSGTWHDVHVAYLQIAAEGGIITFVLYLLFFARGFHNLKQRRRSPSDDPEIEIFAGALYATLIGFIVGAFFAPEAYQYFPYFAVAYTSVLFAIAKEKEQSEIPAADPQNPSSRGWRSGVRAGGSVPVRGGPSSRIPSFRTPNPLFRTWR